jgi:tetratricopeptide (TPR) repeat protein
MTRPYAGHAALLIALLGCVGPARAQPDTETALAAGLRAYAEGRLEDAAAALAEGVRATPTYDGWLTLGLAQARLERFEPARAALDAAIALDARRPDAWIERGGLAFLTKDYARAAVDLRRARSLAPTDADVLHLLASSLHLAGRSDEALALWNSVGQPRLARLNLSGLRVTRERLVRRELGLAEGDVLDLSVLRRGRLRLAELQAFDRVSLRPGPRGDGQADLDAAFVERHGFFASRVEFAATTAVQALQGRARLRYSNLGGAAVHLGGELRWQARRPQASLFADWSRPFGLPVMLRVQGLRGRQLYDVDGEVTAHTRGVDLVARHVAGPRTVLQLDLRARDRRFSRARPDAPGGLVFGPELGLEQRLAERPRLELDAGLRAFRALPAWGSDLAYARGVATLEGRLFLAPREGTAFERSVLAGRLRGGRASRATPLDDLFAPGASPEMELPLRAHRQLRRGAIGATPLGRSLLLWNVEWRRRLWSGTAFQAGVVAFYDGARIAGRADRPTTLHDVGAGVRFGLRGAATLRADFAHGLTDGRQSFSLGLGQAF